MSKFTQESGFRPKVGSEVIGQSGKKDYKGVVLEHPKHPGKPFIFSRWGFVGLYIECDDGKKRVVNEIRLA